MECQAATVIGYQTILDDLTDVMETKAKVIKVSANVKPPHSSIMDGRKYH